MFAKTVDGLDEVFVEVEDLEKMRTLGTSWVSKRTSPTRVGARDSRQEGRTWS